MKTYFPAYLYIKFKSTIRWGAFPRAGISMPLWIIAIIGFGDILYISKYLFCIFAVLIWLILYLCTYLILPPQYVRNNSKEWENRYKDKTIFWAVLYWIVCVIIAFVVLDYRT